MSELFEQEGISLEDLMEIVGGLSARERELVVRHVLSLLSRREALDLARQLVQWCEKRAVGVEKEP